MAEEVVVGLLNHSDLLPTLELSDSTAGVSAVSAICTTVDDVLHAIVLAHDAAPPAAAGLLIASTALALWGARLLKPAMALLGAGVGFWFGYEVLARRADSSCSAQLSVGAVAAVGLGAMAACVLDAALFLLGAAAAATVAHFSYVPELDALLLDGTDAPRLADRSVVYYALVALAGLAGGIYVRCRGRRVLRLGTSVLGGAGTAYAVLLLLEPHADSATARAVAAAAGLGIGIAGALLQTGRCRTSRAAPTTTIALKE